MSVSYEEVTASDETWQISKEEALGLEFNMVRTKYVSIAAALDVIKLGTNFAYLFNTLEYVKKNHPTNTLNFVASEISDFSIDLFDAMISLSYITMKMLGYEDTIIKDGRTINKIRFDRLEQASAQDDYSFHFNELVDVAQGYRNTGEMYNFQNPEHLTRLNDYARGFLWNPNRVPSDLVDRTELRDRFEQCLKVKRDMEYVISQTNDYEVYLSLAKDLNSLFVGYDEAAVSSIFDGYNRYSDYLRDKSPYLLDFIDNAISTDIRENTIDLYIRRAMETVMYACESFVASEEFKINSFVTDYVIEYINKMINYFKAYTIDLKDFSIYYLVEDRCRVIDRSDFFATIPVSSQISAFDDQVFKEFNSFDDDVRREGYYDILAHVKDSNALNGPRTRGTIQYEHQQNETSILRTQVRATVSRGIVIQTGMNDSFSSDLQIRPVNPRLWVSSDPTRTFNYPNWLQINKTAFIQSLNRLQGDIEIEVAYNTSLLDSQDVMSFKVIDDNGVYLEVGILKDKILINNTPVTSKSAEYGRCIISRVTGRYSIFITDGTSPKKLINSLPISGQDVPILVRLGMTGDSTAMFSSFKKLSGEIIWKN
jgi:hypothetical protein